MRDGEENEADLLLFQYLEGALPPGQARALEARLATDAELRTQLEYWQEAFVKPDFYDTTPLEQSLLRKPAQVLYAPSAFYMLVLVTMVALLYPLPLARETTGSPAIIPRLHRVPTQTAVPPVNVPFNKSLLHKAVANGYLPVDQPVSSPATRQRVAVVDAIYPVTELQPSTETSTARIGIIPPDRVRKVSLPKNSARKMPSRKERRQLAKMKEKARQTRQANEFMKGNVPYVVPLDLKDF